MMGDDDKVLVRLQNASRYSWDCCANVFESVPCSNSLLSTPLFNKHQTSLAPFCNPFALSNFLKTWPNHRPKAFRRWLHHQTRFRWLHTSSFKEPRSEKRTIFKQSNYSNLSSLTNQSQRFLLKTTSKQVRTLREASLWSTSSRVELVGYNSTRWFSRRPGSPSRPSRGPSLWPRDLKLEVTNWKTSFLFL